MQVEKSPEALLLYLACVQAGAVFLPLNTAYTLAELAYFIGDAEPAVVVCSPDNFGWISKLAFKAGSARRSNGPRRKCQPLLPWLSRRDSTSSRAAWRAAAASGSIRRRESPASSRCG